MSTGSMTCPSCRSAVPFYPSLPTIHCPRCNAVVYSSAPQSQGSAPPAWSMSSPAAPPMRSETPPAAAKAPPPDDIQLHPQEAVFCAAEFSEAPGVVTYTLFGSTLFVSLLVGFSSVANGVICLSLLVIVSVLLWFLDYQQRRGARLILTNVRVIVRLLSLTGRTFMDLPLRHVESVLIEASFTEGDVLCISGVGTAVIRAPYVLNAGAFQHAASMALVAGR